MKFEAASVLSEIYSKKSYGKWNIKRSEENGEGWLFRQELLYKGAKGGVLSCYCSVPGKPIPSGKRAHPGAIIPRPKTNRTDTGSKGEGQITSIVNR